MMNAVGPRIKRSRRRGNKKVTQAELAARLQSMGIDIDRSAISRIETRRRQVTDLEIVGICRALGIKVTDLFAELL